MKKIIVSFLFVITFLLVSGCDKIQYTVNFDSKGGNVIPAVIAARGSRINLPIPVKDSYIFKGWFLNGQPFGNSSLVKKNMTHTASWTAADDELTYVIQKGGVQIQSYTGDDRSFVIPQSIEGNEVLYIGAGAFEHSGLESVLIPDTVQTIEADAFSDTAQLKSVAFYGDFIGSMMEAEFPNALYDATISGNNQCVKSPDPDDPNNDTKWIFSDGCPIEKVLGETTPFRGPDGLMYFSYDVIINLAYDKNVKMPSIDPDAFENSSVQSIELPDRFYYDNQFLNSSSFLTGLEDLQYITVTGNNNLYASVDGVLFSKDMTSMIFYPSAKTDVSYTVPDGVTQIDWNTFNNVKSLQTLIIPSSVTELSSFAFENTDSVNKIEIKRGISNGSLTALDQNGLNIINANLVIYVPDNSVDSYKTAQGWNLLADKIKPISDLK